MKEIDTLPALPVISSSLLLQRYFHNILVLKITMTTTQSLEKEYTMEEVASHNKVDDCWLVIGNDATGKCENNIRLILFA